MRCLYLAEDYIGSKVHHQLCASLQESSEIDMTVFAVRRFNLQSKDLTTAYSPVNYQTIISPLKSSHFFYKYFFTYKIKTKKKLLLQQTDITQFDIIHAATLFSEGALAFSLYKEYKIPYIVAVRGSSINFYLKKMPHLWKLGKEILLHAKKVIFISPHSQRKTLEIKCLKSIYNNIIDKSQIIPNGLEDFWHQHRHTATTTQSPTAILYVGRFDKNKNVLSLIQAVKELRKELPTTQLTLIGGNGNRVKEVISLVNQYDWLHYKGEIYEHQLLLKEYQKHHIFAMLSHSETFGLVYLEAITQGLPVIFSAEQGFDGIFNEGEVGYSANSRNIDNIKMAIKKTIYNYSTIQKNITKISLQPFDWKAIADKYKEIYLSK